MPDNVCYLIRPTFTLVTAVAKHIKDCVRAGLKSQHHIYFVPHRTIACEQILEDEVCRVRVMVRVKVNINYCHINTCVSLSLSHSL
jgi:hypothetical protein